MPLRSSPPCWSPARTPPSGSVPEVSPCSSSIDARGVHVTTTEGGVSVEQVVEKARQYRNWGTWGQDDQVGSANYITPDKVAAAARLVRRGKVFSLALPLDSEGPMTGSLGRINPVHVMLQDGGDIVSGAQDHLPTLRYTGDAVTH